MPIWRMQCSFQVGSAAPRDQLVINPVFNDIGGYGVEDLTDDLADALHTYLTGKTGTRELKVKAYDAQGTKPVYPAAEALRNSGSITEFPLNRETAVCLSFFSGRNIPRRRGRLYVPAGLIIGSGLDNVRPTASMRTSVSQLVPIFTSLGGANVDWSIFSTMDNQARAVTDWWVDDEWDVQRRRGLRPTTRLTGTTSELSTFALEQLDSEIPGESERVLERAAEGPRELPLTS